MLNPQREPSIRNIERQTCNTMPNNFLLRTQTQVALWAKKKECITTPQFSPY
jgi:hypothetical protein